MIKLLAAPRGEGALLARLPVLALPLGARGEGEGERNLGRGRRRPIRLARCEEFGVRKLPSGIEFREVGGFLARLACDNPSNVHGTGTVERRQVAHVGNPFSVGEVFLLFSVIIISYRPGPCK